MAHKFNQNLLVQSGWAPWWLSKKDGDPEWKNVDPTFFAKEIEDGVVQAVSTPIATHTAGLWRQMPASPSQKYTFSAEALAWSSENDEPGSQIEPSDVNMQIGIDPTGGLDPESPLIVWSRKRQPLSLWHLLNVQAKAESSIITLFLKSAPTKPKRQQSAFWKSAALATDEKREMQATIVGPRDTYLAIEPDSPCEGELVIVKVSSNHDWKDVSVMMQALDEEWQWLDVTQLGKMNGRFCWETTIKPRNAGIYDLRFVGDEGARLLARQTISVTQLGELAVADILFPSGKPRLDYNRVYVLLPPTADSKWMAAAVRGSFAGKYTVGFSVDDAGIGDLSQRNIIAINPHHWPKPLTAAWFNIHYPGVNFIPLIAKSPRDLESWLKNYKLEP